MASAAIRSVAVNASVSPRPPRAGDGDIVEAAREHRDFGSLAVDLYAGAIELGLQVLCRRAVRGHRPPRSRSARASGQPDDRPAKWNSARGITATRGRRGRHGGQIAGEHRGAPDLGRGDAGGAGDRTSAITPARAPWRSSPPRRRRKGLLSVSVAAAKKAPHQLGSQGLASPCR